MRRNEFTCRRAGKAIRGSVYRPDEGDKLPIIIISHGFMGDMRGNRGHARYLAKKGFCVFVFDFCGGGPRSTSDGATTEMSVLTEVEDLLAVVDYASSRPYTDETNLTLMGFSQGGIVSALTAPRIADRVNRLVLVYPAFCIPDDARKGSMIHAHFDPKAIPETIECGPMLLGRIYPGDVIDMDPIKEASAFTGPVLLLHGTEDAIVNVSYAYEAAAAYKKCELVIFEHEGHGFTAPTNTKTLDLADNFIRRT